MDEKWRAELAMDNIARDGQRLCAELAGYSAQHSGKDMCLALGGQNNPAGLESGRVRLRPDQCRPSWLELRRAKHCDCLKIPSTFAPKRIDGADLSSGSLSLSAKPIRRIVVVRRVLFGSPALSGLFSKPPLASKRPSNAREPVGCN